MLAWILVFNRYWKFEIIELYNSQLFNAAFLRQNKYLPIAYTKVKEGSRNYGYPLQIYLSYQVLIVAVVLLLCVKFR